MFFFNIAATFPLSFCGTVVDLNNDEVSGATLTGTTSVAGPFPNYQVYSYSEPTSELTIPASSFGITGDRLRTIAFAIKLNTFNQDKQLFEIVDDDGFGLKVSAQGQDLVLETNFKDNGQITNATLSRTSTFAAIMDQWQYVRLDVGFSKTVAGESSPATDQYKASLDAVFPDGAGRSPPFVVGDVKVNNFDGALACLYLSEDNVDDVNAAPLAALNECFSYSKTILIY